MSTPAVNKLFILRGEPQIAAMVAFINTNAMACAEAGHPLAVHIEPEKSKRSLQQNRRYFGAILKQIEDQAWMDGRQYSAEVWHEYFKRQFIGLVDLPKGGSHGQSSANLSVSEFQTFMDQVEAWAARELGVIFTEPEP